MFNIVSDEVAGKGHVIISAGESARYQRRVDDTARACCWAGSCGLVVTPGSRVCVFTVASVFTVKMSDLKWNVDNVIKFLNIFRNYPCLWDPSDANHIKRDARDAAMKGLVSHIESEGFGTIQGEQLKAKIKSLKDSYRVELNKVKKSIKSGAGADDIYKPKLGWFIVADSFWRKVMSGRESSSNLDLSQVMKNTEGEEQPATEQDEAQSSGSSTADTPSPVTKSCKRSPTKMRPPPPARPSKFLKKNQTRFERGVSQLQKIAELTAGDSADVHEKFGQLIAAKMRDMPLRSVLVLQDKILGLITEESLRLIDEAATPSASPSTTASLSATPWSSPASSGASQGHVAGGDDQNSADLLSCFLTQL